ncbi:MAG: hypothetical protein P8Y67_11795 [Alphaproteobacteria bacterium]
MVRRVSPIAAIAAAFAVFVLLIPLTSIMAQYHPAFSWTRAALAADKTSRPKKTARKRKPRTIPPAFKDDPDYQRSAKLLAAISEILNRAAKQRAELRDLPRRDNYLIPPLWRETREDREKAVRELLNSALTIVTDAPIVKMQDKLAARRKSIATMRDQITALREKRLHAPENSLLPGVLSDTQKSIDADIATLKTRIKDSKKDIAKIKQEMRIALRKAGVSISAGQFDLLLDSVLGSDVVKLVTAFQAARAIDARLGELLKESNEDIKTARRYFAMHAALFAMMVHAQDMLIEKIDVAYVPKLQAILDNIVLARDNTERLLETQNRPDQKRALKANIKSQNFSEKVARFYRDYLLTQRDQLVKARNKTLHDLEIADNTFETVEVSFQLHALMKDARTSFEALQRLEAPGFEQIFKNKALRKEFENLTRKLGPTS